jgi:hypothetical protein
MPKRALIEHRPWLLAAIAGATAYFFLRSSGMDDMALVVLKGSGVAFLAVYAWQRLGGFDGRLLALVMALSSVGDMAIEFSLIWGGGAFALSHIAAIALYSRHWRAVQTTSQRGAAVALLILAPLVSWLLSGDVMVGIYGVTLGAMAAMAWSSKFSRYRVGIGALLFVVSDWLIFLNIGAEDAHSITSLLIWPLYFAGQLLIATGVVQTLRHELPDAA